MAQYVLGDKLYDGTSGGSTKSTHSGVAVGIETLFAVNTVTGVWNMWESRKDPNAGKKRFIHGFLMLGADVGFVATGMLAPGDEGGGESEHAPQRRDHVDGGGHGQLPHHADREIAMVLPATLVHAAETWASFYSDHAALRIGVVFCHFAGLMAGGGLAVAADRGTLRLARGSAAARAAHLDELHAIHRVVIAGLALTFASGILMVGADLDAMLASPRVLDEDGARGPARRQRRDHAARRTRGARWRRSRAGRASIGPRYSASCCGSSSSLSAPFSR